MVVYPRPYELDAASSPPPPPDFSSAADEDEDEDELDLDEDDDREEAAERRVDRDALEARDEREWTLAVSSAAPAVRDLAGGVSGVPKSSTPVGESGPVLSDMLLRESMPLACESMPAAPPTPPTG
mmetsp:Transcript_30655/g.81531  ORF Transcript_30655/g.81531 Transcript_30655/m.81531 type:complete len:126 (+) Transcript_30655:325-702(+)